MFSIYIYIENITTVLRIGKFTEKRIVKLWLSSIRCCCLFLLSAGSATGAINRSGVWFSTGYIWQEILDVRKDGLKRYLDYNTWNYVEFARNKMYVAVIALRTYAYITENIQITNDPSSAYIPREKWDTFDPQILADALFAASNILRCVEHMDILL